MELVAVIFIIVSSLLFAVVVACCAILLSQNGSVRFIRLSRDQEAPLEREDLLENCSPVSVWLQSVRPFVASVLVLTSLGSSLTATAAVLVIQGKHHTLQRLHLFQVLVGLGICLILWCITWSGLPQAMFRALSMFVENLAELERSCPKLKVRLFTIFTFLPMEADQMMDGNVIVQLFDDRNYLWVLSMLLIVVVPQLLVWAFLFQASMSSKIALARIIFFPLLSAVAFAFTLLYSMSHPVQRICIFAGCLAVEHVYDMLTNLIAGTSSRTVVWAAIGEGLLEASANGVLTLYILFVRQRSATLAFEVSVAMSCLSITKAALQLHFYGSSASFFDKLRHFIISLPRIVSRITSFAAVAYLTRLPQASHAKARLIFCILVVEITLNAVILHVVNGRRMARSVTALLSMVMLVSEPPGFLSALARVRLPQLMAQHVLLFLYLNIAACLEEFPDRVSLLWENHHHVVVIWISSLSVAFVSALMTLPGDSLNAVDLVVAANKKLYDAAKERDVALCQLLISVEGADASVEATWVSPKLIPTGSQSGSKCIGIHAHGDKLYCSPYDEDNVLVVHPSDTSVSLINTGRQGPGKWNFIDAFEDKLYCAPCNETDVLVIDSKTQSVSFILTGRSGIQKWCGITVFNKKLYCTPFTQDDVLVIDPVTASVAFIPTGRSGPAKWSGIVAVGGKLYCAPFNERDVLVIDPHLETVDFIDIGRQGLQKWRGIAEVAGKLYCAPFMENDVLEIDLGTRIPWFIPTGRFGGFKWSGICVFEAKLYCAPLDDPDVLVIDAGTSSLSFIPTGRRDGNKWSGIAEYDRELYCAPRNEANVLAGWTDERRLLSDLFCVQ